MGLLTGGLSDCLLSTHLQVGILKGYLEAQGPVKSGKITTHGAPLCAVLYSKTFRQVSGLQWHGVGRGRGLLWGPRSAARQRWASGDIAGTPYSRDAGAAGSGREAEAGLHNTRSDQSSTHWTLGYPAPLPVAVVLWFPTPRFTWGAMLATGSS